MTELYQHANSEQALCEQCVKDTMNYSAGMRLRDWMQVEDGECGRCAAMPKIDRALLRQNTSIRHGICTQTIGDPNDPTRPSLTISYGVPAPRRVERNQDAATPWSAFAGGAK
jgi:hypothetical protein